ncbi:MAG: MBL fold metallo-hydrolase [Rubrivivax sp. SCN 71-131]|nr:MAG: MBL fold metallo-hydrolase [Rubrivivax sp. SCN 71-131]
MRAWATRHAAGSNIRAWLLGTLLLCAGGCAFAQAAPATVRMDAQAVADGIWFVQGESAMGSAANQNFISNAAFIITPEGVVVIDALGSPPLAERLLELIRERTRAPLRWVIVTHCHADHIYGLQVMKAAGARIVAHAGCREYLAGDTARLRLQASREELFPWVDEATHLVTPDQWIGEPGAAADLVLDVGGRRLRVGHAGPAHTPEDLVVFDEKSGVLFTGDIVFRGRVPFVGQADSRRWIEALERMLQWQPRILVPGHGPLSHHPSEDLALTRDYLQFLRQAMGQAARDLEPFDEAYARTDWSRFAALPLFAAANRMNAYNTYLLMEHEGE